MLFTAYKPSSPTNKKKRLSPGDLPAFPQVVRHIGGLTQAAAGRRCGALLHGRHAARRGARRRRGPRHAEPRVRRRRAAAGDDVGVAADHHSRVLEEVPGYLAMVKRVEFTDNGGFQWVFDGDLTF